MATISDLSSDLVEEILSRVPIASLGAVRSTCKRWNTLSKSRLLCKAQANQQFVGFMTKNSKLCSLRFNLHDEEFSVKEISDSFGISKVLVCNGLLLCVTVTGDEKDNNIQQRLMVWNPYLGQTRWIQPSRTPYCEKDTYALGYDNNRCNHKILRYIIDVFDSEEELFEIYDFNSDSWRSLDLDVTPDWGCGWGGEAFRVTVSLKGNTYFMFYDSGDEAYPDIFLCFDFTRERFGEKLHLPSSGIIPFSSFGEEKLAAFSRIGIWVTTKIEPSEVLWSIFLKIDLEALPRFLSPSMSLFVDEDKKRAVVFSSGFNYVSLNTEKKEYQNAVYIIGENNFFKTVYLGENPPRFLFPVVYSNSYAPSLVQIKQNCTERQEEEASQEALVLQKKIWKWKCPFYNNMLFVSWIASFSIFFLVLVAAMYFYQG